MTGFMSKIVPAEQQQLPLGHICSKLIKSHKQSQEDKIYIKAVYPHSQRQMQSCEPSFKV